MVFELCERFGSLGAEALGAVSSEFHENAGTASLAADSIALSVERFEVSAVGALVVNEFNHSSLSKAGDFASCFQCVSFDRDLASQRKQRDFAVGFQKRPLQYFINFVYGR